MTVERIPFDNIEEFSKKLNSLENLGYIWAGSKVEPSKGRFYFMVYKENTVLEIFHDEKQIGFTHNGLGE